MLPILENFSLQIPLYFGDGAFVAWQVEIRKLAPNYNIWNLNLIDKDGAFRLARCVNAPPPYLAKPPSLFWTIVFKPLFYIFLLIIIYLLFSNLRVIHCTPHPYIFLHKPTKTRGFSATFFLLKNTCFSLISHYHTSDQ